MLTTTTALLLVLLGLGYACGNPLIGLVDPACFVVGSSDCPNENVTFWLYSKWVSCSIHNILFPLILRFSLAAPHAMLPFN